MKGGKDDLEDFDTFEEVIDCLGETINCKITIHKDLKEFFTNIFIEKYNIQKEDTILEYFDYDNYFDDSYSDESDNTFYKIANSGRWIEVHN